eukprot:765022-Hanusia_phi.AAC.5
MGGRRGWRLYSFWNDSHDFVAIVGEGIRTSRGDRTAGTWRCSGRGMPAPLNKTPASGRGMRYVFSPCSHCPMTRRETRTHEERCFFGMTARSDVMSYSSPSRHGTAIIFTSFPRPHSAISPLGGFVSDRFACISDRFQCHGRCFPGSLSEARC